MSSKRKPRNRIHLAAYTGDGQQVLDECLPVHRFYEKSHAVLDEPEYRKKCRIARLRGIIYNAEGAVAQEFEVRFNASGFCVGDAARFADGSVAGCWELGKD
jgi:hypothetical protein